MAATDNRKFLCTESPEVPEGAGDIFDSWAEIYEAQHAVYRAQAAEVDALIEDFVRETPDERVENALVIVAGDHGQLFGEEGMAGHHTSLHPGGVQVPCYVSFPADWKSAGRDRFRQPMSMLGIARVLPDVTAGQITSADEFLRVAHRKSHTDGELLVCADGPTWNESVISETPPSEREKLAVRCIGYVREETLVEYASPWVSERITQTEYDLTNVDRTPRESREADPENEEHAHWLRSSPDESEISNEVNQRLEQLGYV